MKKHVKTKLLVSLLMLVMLLSAAPSAILEPKAAPAAFPLTLTLHDSSSGTEVERTFQSSDEKLGYGVPQNSRSNWYFRTYRRVFLGWSADPKFADSAAVNSLNSADKLYRDNEPLSAILDDLGDGTVLYAVSIPVTDLAALSAMLANGGGTFHTNILAADDQVFEQTDLIKESSGLNDLTATERSVVSYFDGTTDRYGIRCTSEFVYTDARVPILVVENPLAVIRSAKGITDFSGPAPTGYTYEDLHVQLDPTIDISTEQNNWTFTSSTFMVAAVLDAEGNLMDMTSLTQPDSISLVSTFSFKNPDKKNEFFIRTIPRNDNTDSSYGTNDYPSNNILTVSGADIQRPMELCTGDWNNLTISKENARKAAVDDTIANFTHTGFIDGSFSIDKKNLTGGAALIAILLPDAQPIGHVDSKNTMVYDFVPATARFDRNTAAFGDTAEQTIGFSIFAVNQAMDADDFNTGTAPGTPDAKGDTFAADFTEGQAYTINGKSYVFCGWNTAADGSGTAVSAASPLTKDLLTPEADQDINLYAQWAEGFTVSHRFVSLTQGKDLPQEVMAHLPADRTNVPNGTEVRPTEHTVNEVSVSDGTWKHESHTPASAVVNGADVVFECGWRFTSASEITVTPTDPAKPAGKTPAGKHTGLATGDNRKPLVWGGLLLGSLILIGVVLIARKKNASK